MRHIISNIVRYFLQTMQVMFMSIEKDMYLIYDSFINILPYF